MLESSIFWSVATAAIAWLITKRMEISDRRRVRYIELVAKLSSLFEDGAASKRSEFLDEVSKLWIDGSAKVVSAAEQAMSAVEANADDAEERLRDLVLAMRKDVEILAFFRAIPRDHIRFRSAGSSSK